MIRRNVTTENEPPGWLLISQVEHARLSGELAERWVQAAEKSTPSFWPLVACEELLPAIYHHDDGWRQWEQSPQVDSITGQPLAFTEMPLPVALEIWRKSIDSAQQIGPLAAWVVAGHFTALLGKSHEAHEPSAVTWLDEFEDLRSQWLQSWRAIAPEVHVPPLAETALHQLQLFDYLSLWLCMAERNAPQSFDTPGGSSLTITPRPRSNYFTMHPWPLTTLELELTIAGRLIPARFYASSDELANAAGVLTTLAWHFVPQ